MVVDSIAVLIVIKQHKGFFVLQVDPSGKYENLVTVRSFNPEFRLAGGVNLPKIIDCVGSDGRERRQLVKVCWTNVKYYKRRESYQLNEED